MKIGALTIGQSPRNDLIPEIEAFFKGAEIIQLGALDGLSKEQIADLAPSGDDEILVSKLKDDSWALMAESKIISLLQERTDELCRRGVSLIVLLCTGMFSKELVASVPVIYPQKLLYSIVPILAGGRKLGIISPDPKQTEQNYERWQKVSDNIVVGFEDAVGEPVLTHEVPEIFDRVQFRRLRRQRQDRDVAWDDEIIGHVPARLIHDEDGMRIIGHVP